MSLINQVLRDLDQHPRSAQDKSTDSATVSEFPSAMPTVSPETNGNFKWLVVSVGFIFLLVAGLIGWQSYRISSLENGLVEVSLTLPSPESKAVSPIQQIAAVKVLDLPEKLVRSSVLDGQQKPAVELESFSNVSEPKAGGSSVTPKWGKEDSYLPLVISGEEQTVVAQAVTPPVKTRKKVKPKKTQPVKSSYQKARSLLSNGRLAEAESELRQILASHSTHLSARELLAGLLIRDGRQAEANRIVDEGLKIKPDQPGLALIKARLLSESGQTAQAVSLLERTLPAGKNAVIHLSTLGALYQQQGDHEKAVQSYKAVLEIQPELASAWVGAGISLESLGEYKRALGAYQQAAQSRDLSRVLSKYVKQRMASLANKE